MKRCPECRRDYYDDTLLYCLEDGNALLEGPPSGSGTGSEPATAMFPHGHISSDAPTAIFQTSARKDAAQNSIAVLPFTNISADDDNEYFCDGLAEEILNALSKIDEFTVAARKSAFSFKNKDADISEIGEKLGVKNVLEGSVRKSGNRLRVTVQLVSASDGFQIWSERYDREMRDVFEIQDDIAVAVVNALKEKLFGKKTTDEYKDLIEELKHYRADINAYQLYLRGRFMFNKFTPDDFFRAVDCFERALVIEPNFAAAHAALAEVHVFLTEFGPVPALEGMPKAKEAALKAIEHDSNLSDAHNSLALVLQEFDFDFVEAEKEYKVALRLNPNNAMAYQYYGAWLAQMGRFEKAVEMCQKALSLDPLSPIGTWIYPFVLFLSRRFDEAIKEANKLLELDRNFSAAFLVISFANEMNGNFPESVEAYARFLELCKLPEVAAAAHEAFETAGWQGFLRAMTAPDAAAKVSSYINAVHYAALGENGSTIAALERSFDKREGYLVMLKVDPRFDEVRSDERFQKLIRKIGFTD